MVQGAVPALIPESADQVAQMLCLYIETASKGLPSPLTFVSPVIVLKHSW
jgi:hypothetical protein